MSRLVCGNTDVLVNDPKICLPEQRGGSYRLDLVPTAYKNAKKEYNDDEHGRYHKNFELVQANDPVFVALVNEVYQDLDPDSKADAHEHYLSSKEVSGDFGFSYKIYKGKNTRGFLRFPPKEKSLYLVKYSLKDKDDLRLDSFSYKKLIFVEDIFHQLCHNYFIFYHRETNGIFIFGGNMFKKIDGSTLKDLEIKSFDSNRFFSVIRDVRNYFYCLTYDRRFDKTEIQIWSPDMEKLECRTEPIPSDFAQRTKEEQQLIDGKFGLVGDIFYHQAGYFLVVFANKKDYVQTSYSLRIYSPDLKLVAKLDLPAHSSKTTFKSWHYASWKITHLKVENDSEKRVLIRLQREETNRVKNEFHTFFHSDQYESYWFEVRIQPIIEGESDSSDSPSFDRIPDVQFTRDRVENPVFHSLVETIPKGYLMGENRKTLSSINMITLLTGFVIGTCFFCQLFFNKS